MASTKIAPGSTILVTGADGFIGSAVVTQLLVQGFRVKGTSQSQLRLEEFKKKADQEFGTDKFEIVGGIPDLAVKGVLDNHLEGKESRIKSFSFSQCPSRLTTRAFLTFHPTRRLRTHQRRSRHFFWE